MSKVLCTTLPSNDLGLLARTIPVARELASMGHKVAYCNPAPAPAKLIAEAGLDNLTPPAWPIPTVFAPSTMEVWDLGHFWALIGFLDENFARGFCEAMMALMTDYGADVILDSWNVGACMAAKALRKPLVSIIQGDIHPANKGFIWWRERPPDVPSPVPALNSVLSEHGLPSVRKSEELHVGDLTLVAGTPDTDPFSEDAEVTHVGPILWQRPDAVLPDWIGTLTEDRPLVWVYTGNPTYGPVAPWADSMVLLRGCLAALADEDLEVVLTTGYQQLPDDVLTSLPANFHYEPYLPGLAMAERSDLLIHHGGHGSSMTGLYTGTPAVIVPTYSERESNARRVAALGAGLAVVPTQGASGEKELSVEELRSKVRQVLSDPSFAANARRVAENMRNFGGAKEAARLIDRFVARL
jgi:UDP:flavonoid glycosyltransferase YjiC (YdhE family)